MAVSKRLRFEILRRDEHKCKHCGRTPPEVVLEVDHVVPVTLGGSDDPSNLVAACRDCNGGKSSIPADAPMVAGVADDAARWAAAIQQVAEMRTQEAADAQETMGWFNSVWCAWTNWRDEPYEVEGGLRAIFPFIEAGLTRGEIEQLVSVAMRSKASDKWRYFCGCCWKRVRQNHELAAELVTAKDVPQAVTTVWTQSDVDALLDEADDMASGLEGLLIHPRCCRHTKPWTPEGPWHCGDPVCVVEFATHRMHASLQWHFADMEINRRDAAVCVELEALEMEGADG